MQELIGRLDRWLSINRPDYFAQLLPGVSGAQLDEFEDQFSLELPAAFRQLFSWRNGQDMRSSASLQYNLMFSSLEDNIHIKELMDGMIGSDFEDPRWWFRSWVPFLENGAGDHLCVDLAAENGGTPGQVIMFYHDWEYRPILYTSFEAWLTQLVGDMENGSLEVT